MSFLDMFLLNSIFVFICKFIPEGSIALLFRLTAGLGEMLCKWIKIDQQKNQL